MISELSTSSEVCMWPFYKRRLLQLRRSSSGPFNYLSLYVNNVFIKQNLYVGCICL